MLMVDALHYEYLMRLALQCGRSYGKGADADIYRRLERSSSLFKQATDAKAAGQSSTWGKPISELEQEYKSRLYEVSNNVDRAIAIVLREHSFTEEQRQALEEYRKKLAQPTFGALDEVIDKAQDIMVAAGIKLS
jgi:hypothetical protein